MTLKWPALLVLALLASCARSKGTPQEAPPPSPSTDVPKVLSISKGTAFETKDSVIPGHVVILDFYADW